MILKTVIRVLDCKLFASGNYKCEQFIIEETMINDSLNSDTN